MASLQGKGILTPISTRKYSAAASKVKLMEGDAWAGREIRVLSLQPCLSDKKGTDHWYEHTLNAPCRGGVKLHLPWAPLFTLVWAWTGLQKQCPSVMCSRPRMSLWDRNWGGVSWGARRILDLILDMFYNDQSQSSTRPEPRPLGWMVGRESDSGNNDRRGSLWSYCHGEDHWWAHSVRGSDILTSSYTAREEPGEQQEVFQSRRETWEINNAGAMKGRLSWREWLAEKDHANEKKIVLCGLWFRNYCFPLKVILGNTEYGYLIKRQKNEMKVK